MTTLREAAQMALDAYESRMQQIGGCSDGGCVVVKPKGMHTNGGCRCWKNERSMQRLAMAANSLTKALRAALAQPEQEPVATLFGSLPVYDVPTKQEPVAWMHNFIDEVVIAHRPVDLDRHPDRWTALYKDPTPCQTCEALSRTVMMDQTSHDTQPQREVYCGCGDEIVAGDGARCGTCVAVKYKEKEWQGLTDEEIRFLYKEHYNGRLGFEEVVSHIEAKLKEKNST